LSLVCDGPFENKKPLSVTVVFSETEELRNFRHVTLGPFLRAAGIRGSNLAG